MNKGFFVMDNVKKVETMEDLNEAKNYAISLVKSSSAKALNINKAVLHISKSTSIFSLMSTMTNFMLAHPSEGLKVIKTS